jgi:hypothetical protein
VLKKIITHNALKINEYALERCKHPEHLVNKRMFFTQSSLTFDRNQLYAECRLAKNLIELEVSIYKFVPEPDAKFYQELMEYMDQEITRTSASYSIR